MVHSRPAATAVGSMVSVHLRILLIEDNAYDAELLQISLRSVGSFGWQLHHVELLRDGIAACEAERFDIALLDLSLPDADGLATLIEFRRYLPHLPIVILTGLDDDLVALEALKLGAQDYLQKGQISSQLLAKTIRYAIERHRSAEQLRQSEERYRRLVELCPDAILITTVSRIGFVNSAALALLGAIAPEQIVHRDITDFVHTADQATVLDWLGHTEDGMTVDLGTQNWVKVDSTVIQVEVMAVAVAHQDQLIHQIVVRDVSQQKRIEDGILEALEREQELNRLKSSFVSMISHEFRNPLATMLSFIELLQQRETELDADRKGQYFRVARLSIAQMTQLLDEVGLLSQSETGGLDYAPMSLNLADFCQELVEGAQLRAGDRKTITFNGSGCTTVKMDAVLLRHILDNLLTNAIKYSPERGLIQLRLTCDATTAVFQVSDQGIGIPPQDLPRLFEAFHRARNVGSIQGTGLGLAIVKKCVELHGGRIHVRSELGIGTTVTVVLPLGA